MADFPALPTVRRGDDQVTVQLFQEIRRWQPAMTLDPNGAFHSPGGLQNGWFIGTIPPKMDDDWGYPYDETETTKDLRSIWPPKEVASYPIWSPKDPMGESGYVRIQSSRLPARD